jgi:hypothetical protein
VRVFARKALVQVLEPLSRFVLDSGLSIHEVNSILREVAVKTVAAQQIELARRVNISGIAASTGIPRGEISRILKSKSNYSARVEDRREPTTNKILQAWRRDRKFQTPNGQPAKLKIYGRGPTFESLVRRYGQGIPTRAVLEELLRYSAIEVRPFQIVRLSGSIATHRGLTPQTIKAFGDRASQLLSAMLQNIKLPSASVYVGSVSGKRVSPNAMHMIREELSIKATHFLTDIRDTLSSRAEKKPIAGNAPKAALINVTIFFHETPVKPKSKRMPLTARRNFRRSRSPSSINEGG